MPAAYRRARSACQLWLPDLNLILPWIDGSYTTPWDTTQAGTWPGRLDRDIGHKIAGKGELEAAFAVAREQVAKIRTRKAGDTDKLYTLHAPEEATRRMADRAFARYAHDLAARSPPNNGRRLIQTPFQITRRKVSGTT